MKCPNCDTENRESAKFCDECGFPLSGAIMKATLAGGIGNTEALDPSDVADAPADASDDDNAAVQPSEDVDAPTQMLDIPADDGAQLTEEEAEAPTQMLDMPKAEEEVDGPTQMIETVEDDPFENLAEEYVPSDEDWPDEYKPADDDEPAVDSSDVTVVLSGVPEGAEGDSEQPVPGAVWHDGHTMKMEAVEVDSEAKAKDYLASSTAQKNPKRKKIAIIAGVAIILAIAVAAATYALEIWGGKTVPDVTGLTESEATTLLTDEGFQVKSLEVKSDGTEGLVLVMDPSAGSRAEAGSEIMIHIATARLIPEIIGMQKDKAAEMLEESGFTNVSFTEERSSRPLGEVIAVSPEVGTRTKSGDAVTVTTAKPYTVPDISNMYLSDAQAAIDGEGLVSAVEYIYTEDYPDGNIIGTNPAAGTEVQEGSTVTIQIARSREAECIALTQSYLAPGNSINVGLYGYEIESIESLTYMGNSIVAYSVTARPFISGFGETAYFSSQPLAGQIEWTASNTIASMT